MRNHFSPVLLLASALALLVASGTVTAQTGSSGGGNSTQPSQAPRGNPSSFGPGMMGPGYGMGRGYGPGRSGYMTPEQRQQHWDFMRQQGYQPGTGRYMTPEQRQQHWEDMRQQGYGPGMMGPGGGMMGPGSRMMGPGWGGSN